MAAPINQGRVSWWWSKGEWINIDHGKDGNHGEPHQLLEDLDVFEGDWHEGNAPIMGPRTHAAWLGSTVFDGARAFEGTTPDLDRHCARVNQSAINFKLKPVVDLDTWLGLAREGIARLCAARRALCPTDVLGAAWRRRRRAVRS